MKFSRKHFFSIILAWAAGCVALTLLYMSLFDPDKPARTPLGAFRILQIIVFAIVEQVLYIAFIITLLVQLLVVWPGLKRKQKRQELTKRTVIRFFAKLTVSFTLVIVIIAFYPWTDIGDFFRALLMSFVICCTYFVPGFIVYYFMMVRTGTVIKN
jgi:hypothetical protein